MAKVKIAWEKSRTFDVSLINLQGKCAPPMIVDDNGDIKELETKDDGTPLVVRRHEDGQECTFVRVLPTGEPVVGTISNMYMHPDKGTFKDADLDKFYVSIEGDEIPFTPKEKTDIFEITSYEPIENYINKYQLTKYYQVMPSDGAKSKSKTSKKDVHKALALNLNIAGMFELWRHLNNKKVIGRGQLNVSSTGRLPSYGYIRAVTLPEAQWTLEVALFKQQKEYLWSEALTYTPAKVKEQKTVRVVEI
jgi:hypothetical protein